MTIHKTHRALVALAAVLTLSGCGTAPGGGTASPSSPAATESTPAPTAPTTEPSATATEEPSTEMALDDPSTWIISATGVGPLVLGEQLPQIAKDLTPLGWTEGCGPDSPIPDAPALFSPEGDGDLWVAAGGSTNEDGTVDTALASVSLGNLSDSAAENTASPRTAGGIGLGSPLSDVPDEFPNAEAATWGHAYNGYTVASGATTLYFGAQSGDVVTGVAVTSQAYAPMGFCS